MGGDGRVLLVSMRGETGQIRDICADDWCVFVSAALRGWAYFGGSGTRPAERLQTEECVGREKEREATTERKRGCERSGEAPLSCNLFCARARRRTRVPAIRSTRARILRGDQL